MVILLLVVLLLCGETFSGDGNCDDGTSKVHLDSWQASLLSHRARKHGTVAQQLQESSETQQLKNREAVSRLMYSTPQWLMNALLM